MMSSEVAHVVPPEQILIPHQTARHVAIVPMTAVSQVVALSDVNRPLVSLAVVGVIAHRLPAPPEPCASSDRLSRVVAAVIAVVLELFEVVRACGDAVLALELHVVPGADGSTP